MTEKFTHKKSLGQHFLNSDYVPKQMCDAGGVAARDVVLEIGPGTGALTKEILARGATVVAIEADERAIESLQQTFASEITSKQLTIHHMDARAIDFTALNLTDHSYKVIANIPYYISGLLFRQCLESDIQPTDLVFLVQKEVAERIARDPKGSILSHSVRVFGDPTYVCTVKRGHFTPPPSVDSAVIAVNNISRSRLADRNLTTTDWFDFLHLAFGQKRKQLAGNLSADTRFSKDRTIAILEGQGIPPTVRAEDLSTEQLLDILQTLIHE